MSYLKQHASNLPFLFLFFLEISDNQWQIIRGILKNVFKISSSPPIQIWKPITLLDASFTYFSSPCTILRTHNIPWGKFYWLFFNTVKRGKGRETQNRLDRTFTHNCCQWLSEESVKFWVRYFTVSHFKSNWRHLLTHYVSFV